MWFSRAVLPIAGMLAASVLLPLVGAGTASNTRNQFDQPLAASAGVSSAFVKYLVSAEGEDYGSVGVNEMPIWTVGADQATVKVSVTSGCSDFTSDTGTQIPIPAGVTTSGTSVAGDSPLVIDQPSTHTEWELWKAVPAGGGNWSACYGGKLDTATSNGVFPSPWGMSASGISYLSTAITESDVASGSINHAIAVNMPGCTSPEVAPADRSDCSSDPGAPPYGTWFRLPAALTMPAGLAPFAQMVFRALQTYGMVYTDQGGAVMLYAEDTTDWSAQGHTGVDPITASWDGLSEYQVVADIPWNDLTVDNHGAP
jgi:hypothetical protein